MKLWFFRTPGNCWGYCDLHVNEDDMEDIDAGEAMIGLMYYVKRPTWWKRNGFPELQPGECVPVELMPVVKTKKARKG